MKINILIVLSLMILTGCSTTVPVKAKFPGVPTANYNTYYECALKHDAWIEWYQTQKNIFESVK